MRKVTVALLGAAYLCLALTAALFIWRAGGGWGAAVAVLIGAVSLALCIQALIQRAGDSARFATELAKLRNAHMIVADQIEQLSGKLGAMDQTLHDAEELTGEVRMLEDLVQRMTLGLEGRSAGAATAALHGHQQHALLETVREALADNRVDLYLQPIVSLPQRRTVFYESYSRLRDDTGRVMMPAEYLSVAEPQGLVSAIDNLLLFRCVQIVRRLAKQDRKVAIFCNISLASLADEVFFPQFLEFLADNKDLHGALIFELGQAAFKKRGNVEARNMAKLADLGFTFSLDKVSDLELDFQDLSRADVKFLKIAAEVLVDQLIEVEGRMALKSLKDLNAADFADLTRRYGVELIAEKVENERQVVDVLELSIAYGQGHLFGQPRAIRDAVLAEAEPPADFMKATLRRYAAAGR